ncbi:MAG: aldolase/citrate lyase family protein [Vulcanimicrobiota bacterium]
MVKLEHLPGEEPPPQWQPAYVLYGGAHLFSADTHDKMLNLARRWLKEYPWLGDTAKKRVEKRLFQPLDDIRIDFEDGYGRRSDEEEDAHATQVRLALPQVHEPRRCGIRVKPITRRFAQRAVRTLETALQDLTVWPRGFCVTLPKLEHPAQVRFIIQELERIENGRPPLPLELMIESPTGLRRVADLVQVAGKRARGVHFGPFDFLASCGIGQGDLLHPVNRAARAQLLISLSGSGVELADGPTTQLPLPPHKHPTGAQLTENQKAVRLAWEFHRDQVLATRQQGYFQSWLLHPAQLVSHAAALIQELETALPGALERLIAYWKGLGQARASGGDFDDRATARQWTGVVIRGLELGLIEENALAGQLPDDWQQV